MGLFSFRSKSDAPTKETPVASTPVAEQPATSQPETSPMEDPFTAPASSTPEPVPQEPASTTKEPVAEQPVVPQEAPVSQPVTDTNQPAPAVAPEPVVPETNDVAEEVNEFQVPDLAPVDDLPDAPFDENKPLEENKPSLVFADPQEEEVPEDNSPVESQITIQNDGVTEIFIEKKEYQQMLLSVSAMNSNLQQADDHLTRILDDEGIMTAKLAVWHDILSGVQENLIAIDMRLFNEGDN